VSVQAPSHRKDDRSEFSFADFAARAKELSGNKD